MFLLYVAILFTNTWAKYTWSGAVQANGAFLFNTIIICAFLIAALLISKQMGVYGAGAVMQAATTGRRWLAGYAGTQTIGRLGEKLQQNKAVQSTRIGRQATAAMTNVGGKTFTGSRKQIGDEKAEWLAKQSTAEWAKGYKNLGASGREKFIQSIPEQARGKFLADLKANDPSMYAATMNTLKVRLSAKQLKDFEKAEMQYGMKSQRGAKLGEYIDKINEEDQKKNFKAMDNNQRGELLESWHGDNAKLDKIMKWKEQELDFDEQDKFTQNVLRRASNPAIANYMKRLSDSGKIAEEGMVLKSLSSQQKVHLWDNALKESADSARKFEDKINKLSAEDIGGFNRAASSHVQSKSIPEMVGIWKNLPSQIRQGVIASQKPARTASMMATANKDIKIIIHNDIKAAGVQEKFDKAPGKRVITALNPEGEPGTNILEKIRDEKTT